MELQSLKQMLQGANGFLSINRSTNKIEVQDSHFLGKLVVWIRYKTSSSYRRTIAEAQNQIQEAMMSDKVYGKYFFMNINQTYPEHLKLNKPISARAISNFIVEVEQHADQIQNAEATAAQREQKLSALKDQIGKFSARTGEGEDSRALNAKIDTMLQGKVVAESGINVADINQEGIGEELYKAAVADEAGLLAMADEQQVESHVDKVLSNILDRRVNNAKEELQSGLQTRLAAATLPDDIRQTVEDAIRTSQIIDDAGLDAHVNKIILQLHDADFDGLLDSVCQRYGFEKAAFNLSDIKQALPAYLLERAGQRLSFASVPEHAMDFFREQGEMQKAEGEAWVARLIGTDGNPNAREEFNSRLNKMFNDKIASEPGLRDSNVFLLGIDEEVSRAATYHLTELRTEAQASDLVNTLMSNVLDKRIADARPKLQERLKEHLADVRGLPEQIQDEIKAEIDSMKIATYPQLNERVINVFMQKIDGEFDDIVKETSRKYGFNQRAFSDPQTKERLMQDLKSDLTEYANAKDEFSPLTLTLARSRAGEHLFQQKADSVDAWVKRWSGVDGNPDGRKLLDDELTKLNAFGEIENISAEEIASELNQEILADPKNIAAIESEDDAKAIVLNKLSTLLQPRIEQARLESQGKLYRRIQEANLSHDDNINLQDKIAMSEITTMEQLEQAIRDSSVN